jgi:hypothetical protein
MKKKALGFLLFGTILGLSGYSVSSTAASAPPSPAEPITFPKIDRRPAAANQGRGNLTAIPTYNPDSDNTWQMDLRGYDLSGLDLRRSLNDLMHADFDTRTKWPSAGRMPQGFNWQKIMELGKNPGLGVRSLHVQGITGRGVGLAIIDQPLIVDHREYADRMRLYEEINVNPSAECTMHGPAVASIAVGRTVGVAPEADLYYIGSWTGDRGKDGSFTYNFHYYAQAVRRILEINKQLPEGRKIRVIAMQVGWNPDQAGYDDITAAVKEAKAAGMLVASSSLEKTFGFKFHALGRAPLADPDAFESYEPGIFWAKEFYAGGEQVRQFYAERLMIPMDSWATASRGGAGEYVFYREGGWSLAIPYIAGMYALAAQAKPTLTPEEFWSAAMKTGRTIGLKHDEKTIPFGPILDPVALISALRAK